MMKNERETMKLSSGGIAVVAALCLAMPAAGLAQDEAAQKQAATMAAQDLPTGRAVVDRYVEAIGGVDAVKSQGPRHVRGTFEMAAQGLRGDVAIFAAPPDRFRLQMVMAGLGEIASGYDGTTGWLVHPALGPMVLDGKMLQQTRQQADMRSPLHPDRFVERLETVERTQFEGCDCYKVNVVTRWGEEYFEFYDAETGLLAGSIRSQASPMGEIETTTLVSDYQDVDGLLMPMRSVQRVMGMEQVITLDEVVSSEVDDEVFALPAEIQALLEGEGEGAGGGR